MTLGQLSKSKSTFFRLHNYANGSRRGKVHLKDIHTDSVHLMSIQRKNHCHDTGCS